MTETFTPYRDRPALDKGEIITWRELESGMLFEPMAGAPSLRRVRGTPREITSDSGPAYMIGSEDLDGCPKGGIIGTADDAELGYTGDRYRRRYLDDGRPVYVLDLALS
jgi:hypothetical protein